ncbi:MAG: YdcF family protein [Pseudomonadota bacterium]
MSAAEIVFGALQPSNFLAIVFVVGLFALIRWRRVGTVVIALAAFSYVALGTLPVGMLALRHLEARHPLGNIEAAPDAIILLGGYNMPSRSVEARQIALNEHAERLTTAAALAQRYPEAKLVVSDGGAPSGASVSAVLLRDFGIGNDRLVLEERASSTWENALFSAELVEPSPDGRYILVTSAWHMPRALATMRAGGWPAMIPVPVDHLGDAHPTRRSWNGSAAVGWRLLDIAAREYLALAYYYALGRTDALIPGPAR